MLEVAKDVRLEVEDVHDVAVERGEFELCEYGQLGVQDAHVCISKEHEVVWTRTESLTASEGLFAAEVFRCD